MTTLVGPHSAARLSVVVGVGLRHGFLPFAHNERMRNPASSEPTTNGGAVVGTERTQGKDRRADPAAAPTPGPRRWWARSCERGTEHSDTSLFGRGRLTGNPSA